MRGMARKTQEDHHARVACSSIVLLIVGSAPAAFVTRQAEQQRRQPVSERRLGEIRTVTAVVQQRPRCMAQ